MRTITSAPLPASRADLHYHSTASELSKLGVQRTLGLPECATPPAAGVRRARMRTCPEARAA